MWGNWKLDSLDPISEMEYLIEMLGIWWQIECLYSFTSHATILIIPQLISFVDEPVYIEFLFINRYLSDEKDIVTAFSIPPVGYDTISCKKMILVLGSKQILIAISSTIFIIPNGCYYAYTTSTKLLPTILSLSYFLICCNLPLLEDGVLGVIEVRRIVSHYMETSEVSNSWFIRTIIRYITSKCSPWILGVTFLTCLMWYTIYKNEHCLTLLMTFLW